ncbi:PQQ-dependent dehydrogenase, methanol/ethanol family [Phenylobacterium sp. LjRoot219]|uniref:PQQ-dependent dehydrogenase, methanol/ethanol family n=1 Tax=Phenylobacterium sp. LjRoot219 TaxID=3342283 RepID=UPI003ECC684D
MKSVKALAPAIAVCVLTVLGGCGAEAVRRYSAVGAAENWPSHGGGADESGFSRLRSINTRTVGKLGLEYALDLPGEISLEATPLAVDGVLYFTGSYSAVYAVDAASGELLWKHDPEVWRHNPRKMRFTFPVNRGAAYENGRIFSATLDGRLLALNAKTGKLLWTAQTVDLDSFHTITGAPRTLNGKVIIGNGGGDFGARGYVTAYDAATGRQLWRFYTVPGRPEENRGDPAMERAAATWSGEYWKTGTGGTVWNGITFDPELNRVYIGTGNAGPYDPELRSPGGGDNLYLASIVALDANTGKYVWHYQVNPREAWDYKATANMISATLQIDGKARKVLMQAPTNGFFYVIDRETGKLISAEKTGKVTWAERIDLQTGRPVEAKNIRYETGETVIWPGNQGGHNWQDMAFSPKSGLVYIPYMQAAVRLRKGQTLAPGEVSYGGLTISLVKEDPLDGKGALIAWDPVAQKERWRAPHDDMWNGGALATAGDLVFQGGADGYFSAYNAATGERLWRFYAGQGIIAPPISYSAGGKQYVSVLVGFGGTAGIISNLMDAGWRFDAPRRLLTFSLDGTASLPPTPARHTPLKPLDDPTLKLDTTDVTAGQLLYGMNCAVCHGLALRSAGAPGPDLRESQIALDREALWSVLHDGALRPSGMPQFQELSRQQVSQIQAYIRAGARQALGKGEIATPDVAPGRM